MAKRDLFLLRHGKSAWPDGVADHERPLAPRGITAVPLVGAKLREIAPDIDLVLVSDARRTRETLARLSEVMPDLPVRITPEIYDARPETLLELVRKLPESAGSALLIGHNPGFHALGLYLADTRTSEIEALRRLERKLPTSGLIHLEIAGNWSAVGQSSARLAHFVTPSQLGGVDED